MKDMVYAAQLANNCFDAIFDNEIYLVSNNELNKTNIIGENVAKKKFNSSLEDFTKSEDFENAKLQLDYVEYEIDEPSGFKVFYAKHNDEYRSTITVEIIKAYLNT